jgi:hypothetical protein
MKINKETTQREFYNMIDFYSDPQLTVRRPLSSCGGFTIEKISIRLAMSRLVTSLDRRGRANRVTLTREF